MRNRLPLLLSLLSVSSCAPTPVAIEEPKLDGPKTWAGVLGPLVATRCGVCHRLGDIAPFPLETYAQVKAAAPQIESAVRAKRMPPFPPEQSDESGCPRVDDVRRMSDQEREVLLSWLADGLPQGEVGKEPVVPKNEPLGPPSDTWEMAEEYMGSGERVDDYRCFVIDPKVLTNIPVGAVSVKPGNRRVVHHSAVYLVSPEDAQKVREKDAADPGPGYTCFGGVGVTQAYPTGLWVPGNDAPMVPPHGGVGYHLLPGWIFVVEQHYNYAAGKQADRSSVVLWRANALVTEVPRAMVLGSTEFKIPPHAMGFSADAQGPIITNGRLASGYNEGNEGRVYAVWGHQHQMGKTLEMDLVRADGSRQCLLRIKKWDFNWQSIYRLHDFVKLKAGDQVTLKCTWDNPTAREVSYGENTADEMCFGSMAMLGP